MNRYFFWVAPILWVVFVIVIVIIVAHQGSAHTVTPAYMQGANLWLQGKDLYNGGRGFIYLPQAAILFTPFALLAKYSLAVAEIIWRLFSLGWLIYAIHRFSGLLPRESGKTFLLVTLVTIPLVYSSVHNGQSNTILEALMLLAVVMIASENWNRAAICLIAGIAFKPTMIVLLLLGFGIYRELRWRLILGLAIIIFLPFCCQTPHYVLTQYKNCITMLQQAAALGSNVFAWSQLFGMLAAIKLYPAAWLQDIIRIIAAIGTLFAGIKLWQRFPANTIAILLYSLAVCYLMLMNPRTENTDYGLLAPAVGIFIAAAVEYRAWSKVALLSLLVIGSIFSGNLTFGGAGYEFWSAPLFTLFFAIMVLAQIFMRHFEYAIFIRDR
jgi:alpha-1,2-mannosyltransferase